LGGGVANTLKGMWRYEKGRYIHQPLIWI